MSISNLSQSTTTASAITSANETSKPWNTKWLVCPKCRKNIPTIIAFVSKDTPSVILECNCGNNQILPIEEYLNIINHSLSTSHECGWCSESKLSECLYCIECMKWVCPNCLTSHKLKEKTKDHNFISNEIFMQSKCSVHSNNFVVSFCVDCDTGVCKDCVKEENKEIKDNKSHKAHEIVELKEMHSHIMMATDIKRWTDGINSIWQSNEGTKNTCVKLIDEYMEKLNTYKDNVIKGYETQRNVNTQWKNWLNYLYLNYESIQNYPNYRVIRNFSINANWNINDFIAPNQKNVSLYVNELLQYYKSNYIIKFNISKIYEKAVKVREYWVKNIVNVNSNTFASTSLCVIKFWDSETYQCKRSIDGHSKLITNLIKIENENKLASASSDKTIKLWSTEPPYGCLGTLTGHKSEIVGVSEIVINKTKYLISWGEDGIWIVWDLSKLKYFKVYTIDNNVNKMCVLQKDNQIVVDSRTLIKVYNTDFSKSVLLVGHSDDVTALFVLCDNRLISGSADKTIRIWNIKEEASDKVLSGHNSKVISFYQLKDNSLVSLGDDGLISMWNLQWYQLVNVLNQRLVKAAALLEVNNDIVISSNESVEVYKMKGDNRMNKQENNYILFY